MNDYQLTILIKPELEEKNRLSLLEDVTKQFKELAKQDLWGNRDLAYPIEHQKKAFYAHFEFSAEPKAIAGLDKSLKLNEDVLRYLLIRVSK